MTLSETLDCNRCAARQAVGRFRATNLRAFGPAANCNDRRGGELDLLVDALPAATFFDLGGLQVELEDLLGVRVDLRTPGDLPEEVRDEILAQAQPV
ncbi:MAG: nucleotidyltransferase family protein [Rhodomicrobium sp.]